MKDTSVRTARTPRALAFLLLILAGVLVGCGTGDGLDRQAVSGRVTFDGKALAQGWIEFRPKDPGAVTAGAAPIRDGTYAIEPSEGLTPGSYLVAITGAAPEPPVIPAPTGPVASPPPDPIPSRYNSETSLTADVKTGGANQFDFALDTK